jgi:general stress protein YciG
MPNKGKDRDLSVRDAGRMGGEKVREEVQRGDLPSDFYSQIGHKGGQKVKDLIDKGKGASKA